MPGRGNKPVGPAARILIALSIAAGIALIVVGIMAYRQQQAYPERGAASLPGQAAAAGAEPSPRPAGE